jgi:hypothetical protein
MRIQRQCIFILLLIFSGIACRGTPGGPVAGAADTHCAPTRDDDFGATLYGTEGDDDDCKYHVTWSATEIYLGENVTLTLTVTRKSDGSPVDESAEPYAELELGDSHPGPGTGQTQKMKAPGVFQIGPVRFDKGGRWLVRFHLYEKNEEDDPVSPHGHVAFYVDVPPVSATPSFTQAPFDSLQTDGWTVSAQGWPESPLPRGLDSVLLTVTDEHGSAIDDLSVEVEPFMPKMNHGTSKPSITALGHGAYQVDLLNLYMPGRWELRVQLGAEKKVTFEVDIP